MDYAYRMYSSMFQNMKFYYEQINPATLSGAIDVIVVEQPNGDFHSTPFHVRFGKYGVFNYKEKYVDILINGQEVKTLRMKLSESGIAFFVEETDEKVPDFMLTSPVPGDLRPGTDSVLAETSRTLERHLKKTDGSASSSSSSTSISRPMSTGVNVAPSSTFPVGASPVSSLMGSIRRSKSMVRSSKKKDGSMQDINASPSIAQQRKMTLPYSSSVFSTRKNRSLPNLSIIDDNSSSSITQPPEEREKSGTVVAPTQGLKTPSSNSRRVPRLRHTKSQALNRERRRSSSSGSREVTPTSSVKKNEKKESEKLTPSKSSPITIQVSQEDDGHSSSGSSSGLSSPAPQSRMATMDAVTAAHLAEGALSDSELDRHKASQEQNGNDVTVWNWGQFPKTREEQKKEDAEPAKPKQSYWSNWWWRSSNTTTSPAKGKNGGSTPDEMDGGIYLDDLLTSGTTTDPSKLEKYLGKPGTAIISTDADSGNGSRQHTSPSSPSALSSTDVEVTPEDQTPTQESVVSALNKVEDNEGTLKKKKERAPSEIFAMSEEEDVTQEDELSDSPNQEMRFIRTLRLSSERLKSLGLQWGANECRFSITTKFQGTSWCACNIYLYKHTDKIVISDIDGTITKSDVLGHIIPAIGGQWAHLGVAELYTRIKQNGYKLVYLSSRAIGQSSMTKNYLKKVQQDSRVLPEGPVLLAPDSVLVAFRREVIERKPEEFKIAALSDLKKLFHGQSPFFAGFGNRETDVKSYKAVGVETSRILIIDPSGTVKRADSEGYKSSYKCMAQDSVDCIFPPILDERTRKVGLTTSLAFSRPQTSSAHTYWTNRDYDGGLNDADLAKYEAKRKDSKTSKKKK